MKDVLISRKLLGDEGDPQFGSWWEFGHWEIDYVKELAEKKGRPEIEAYHVLLTREEWNEIQAKLEVVK